MEKGKSWEDVLKLCESLESMFSEHIVVIAETLDGEKTEVELREILSENGELKEGYKGIGKYVRGVNFKDIIRLLAYYKSLNQKELTKSE